MEEEIIKIKEENKNNINKKEEEKKLEIEKLNKEYIQMGMIKFIKSQSELKVKTLQM